MQKVWMYPRWAVRKKVFNLARPAAKALRSMDLLPRSHTLEATEAPPLKPNHIWLERLAATLELRTSSVCLRVVDNLLSYSKNMVNSLVWLQAIKTSTKCKRVAMQPHHKGLISLKVCEVLDLDLKEPQEQLAPNQENLRLTHMSIMKLRCSMARLKELKMIWIHSS